MRTIFEIQPATKEAYRLFHTGILALAKAERQGIRIDTEYCQRKSRHLDRKIEYYQKQLEETKLFRQWRHIYRGKTNIHSNHQLADLLYNKMKIKPEKTTEKGKGATDEQALSQLDVPGLEIILQIRKLSKVKNTYLEGFIKETTDGFMHPFFNLHTVRTFRSSSADPNFQNIPIRDEEAMKITRRAILPREGRMLVEADFSALEVNISQCYHHDPVMLKYLTDKNSDMHLDMAREIYMMPGMDRSQPVYNTMRSNAKSGFIFPQFYGDYYGNNALSIAERSGLPRGSWKKGTGLQLPDGSHIADHFRSNGINSFDRFLEHMKKVEDEFWNDRFRGYHTWRQNSVKEYRKKGYLQTHTGFVCSGIMRRNEIMNYPIQGSAFHCLLFTFIEMDRVVEKNGWQSKLIGQIHDSIVMDVVPEELEGIKHELKIIVEEKLPEAWKWIIVPLEIDIDVGAVDGSWDQM